MPHVKIEGADSPEELFPRLPVFSERDETGVRKVIAYYRERDRESILAEAVVASGGLPLHFFVVLKWEGERVLVRPLPATSPEATDGVKRLVARLGLTVLGLSAGARIVSSNLRGEIAVLEGENGAEGGGGEGNGGD